MTTHNFVVIIKSSFGLWKQQLLRATWQDKVFDTVDEISNVTNDDDNTEVCCDNE